MKHNDFDKPFVTFSIKTSCQKSPSEVQRLKKVVLPRLGLLRHAFKSLECCPLELHVPPKIDQSTILSHEMKCHQKIQSKPIHPQHALFGKPTMRMQGKLCALACILIVWMKIANGHSKFSTYLSHMHGGLCHKRQGRIMSLFGPKSFKR